MGVEGLRFGVRENEVCVHQGFRFGSRRTTEQDVGDVRLLLAVFPASVRDVRADVDRHFLAKRAQSVVFCFKR